MGQHSSYSMPDGWESASMSDDDEDGEWVDVHHSSDEDTGEIVSGCCLYVVQLIAFTFELSGVLSPPVPGGEAAGNSRGREKSQSSSDQQQQAPDAR